ncbi:MAG: hypothetical protein ACLP22_12365 [Solirubrobacteraceae bacterium]
MGLRDFWDRPPTEPPYVHRDDLPYVAAYNRICIEEHAGWRYYLHTDLIPEPFLGPRNAKLVILNKNPSLDEADRALHSHPGAYREALLGNLRSPNQGFPHLLPGAPFEHSHSGRWWRRTLRLLVDETGSPAALASRIVAVEFHGYHAHKYRAIPVTLPSQYYGFELVRAAIGRGAVVVVMRGHKEWDVAVPELRDHPRVLRGKSQNAAITPGNVTGDFDMVLAAVG